MDQIEGVDRAENVLMTLSNGVRRELSQSAVVRRLSDKIPTMA